MEYIRRAKALTAVTDIRMHRCQRKDECYVTKAERGALKTLLRRQHGARPGKALDAMLRVLSVMMCSQQNS